MPGAPSSVLGLFGKKKSFAGSYGSTVFFLNKMADPLAGGYAFQELLGSG